jgi:hypothetical protein
MNEGGERQWGMRVCGVQKRVPMIVKAWYISELCIRPEDRAVAMATCYADYQVVIDSDWAKSKTEAGMNRLPESQIYCNLKYIIAPGTEQHTPDITHTS